MAKEITLEDLAKGSLTSQTNTPIQTKLGNVNKQRPVSIADVAKAVQKSSGVEPKKEEVKTPELLKNAMDSMYATIEKKKDFYEKEVFPVMYKNAEEMALENKMKNMGLDEEEIGSDDTDDMSDEPQNTSAEKQSIENATYNIPSDDKIDFSKPDLEEDVGPESLTDELEDEDDYVKNDANMTSTNVESLMDNTDIYVPEPEDPENLDGYIDQFMDDMEEELSDDDNPSVLDDDTSEEDTDDEDDTDEDDDEEETEDEALQRLKSYVEDLPVINNVIDLSKAKIKRGKISSAAILKDNKVKHVKKADWPLFHSKRCVTFSECGGYELNTLYSTMNNSNETNAVIAALRFVYSHIIDNNKPTFEEWCKTVRTEDVQSLYFGIYRASFADYNMVTRDCKNQKCGKTVFVKANINDMIEFDDDETKEEFYKLFRKDTTTEHKELPTKRYQLSDKYVVDYSYPTLYNAFIQFASLSQKIRNRYQDIINLLSYIDNFYLIDTDGDLIKIEVEEYKNNINKTTIKRCELFGSILRSLTNDQYGAFVSTINKQFNESKFRYVYPECVCPECGEVIPKATITDNILNLLFTRVQLAQIKYS